MDISFPVPDFSDDELAVERPSDPPPEAAKDDEEVFKGLKKFYEQNAASIERSRNLDLKKGEKDADFQVAMDTFVETTKVILDGLTALANVHPVLGIAIFAFHGVITLDLTRRENDRKVLAVKLQMQSMMCSMFQMCKLKHAHVEDDDEKQAQRAELQALIKRIADEITQCGSDFNYYSNRKTVSKLINAKIYQRRFADHIETFALRRSELQTVLAAYTASGIDAANVALAEVKKTTATTEAKIDTILSILQRLESPQDREVLKFIDENGGPKNCVFKDDLLHAILSKTRQTTSEIDSLRNSLREEVMEDLDAVLKSNLKRYEKILQVQNHNLERISDQISQVGKTMSDHDMKLDTIMRTSILIYEEGKTIKKAVAPTAPIKLKDPELQRIWDQMGLRRSVKAKQFVLTFRDYLITSDQTMPNTPYMTSSGFLPPADAATNANGGAAGSALFAGAPQVPQTTLHPSGQDDSDEWVLKHIDVAHIQPIIEAMDEDGSGFISVQEANKFALRRPPGMRLLHWIAYWASGWHYNVTDYRKKIYSIMIQMHRMTSKVLLVNRKIIHMYLDSTYFFRLESILRSIKPLSDSVVRDPQLTEIADSIAETQEKRLKYNLKTMGYLIKSPEDIALIAGSSRTETWLLPLLYLVLERHLEVFKLSQTTVLHMLEMKMHGAALDALLTCYDERTARLTDIFQQVHKDTEAQFKNYAHGMFLGSYKWTGIEKPMENSLLLDNDALYLEEEDEEAEKKDEDSKDAAGPAKPQAESTNEEEKTVGEVQDSEEAKEEATESSDKPPTEDTGDAEQGTVEASPEVVEKVEDGTPGVGEPGEESEKKEGAEHGSGLDHSILLEGLGPTMELPEIDLGDSHVLGPDAHPIEGGWVATYETTNFFVLYPPFQFSVTSIADGKVQASARYFTLTCEPEGTFDAEENTLDIKITWSGYNPRRFIGKFDEERNMVEGRWVTPKSKDPDVQLPSPYEVEESDSDYWCGTFKFARHTPSAFRFRALLKESPPEEEPQLSIARKRWAFAIEAVRFDVQQRLGSWDYMRQRIEERNAWVELSMRDMLELVFTSTRGFISSEQRLQFRSLMHTIHPSIISVYETMSLYLFDRYWYNVGVVSCDSCAQRIVFRRYTCITCVEEDFHNAVDFCVEGLCPDTLTQFDRRDFVHSFSHTLLRSTQRILGYEMPFLFVVSQLRSERVKRSFREAEAAASGADPNLQKVASTSTGDDELKGKPSVTALICCVCNQDLTLPCWACASCDIDLLFCVSCEKSKRPPSKKTSHSRDHHMLRITDSVEAKVIKLNTSNKDMEDMESRINERIAFGLENLESRVLGQTQARMVELEEKITAKMTALESKVEMLLQLLQQMVSKNSVAE